jgi:hypothetical protein
MNEVIEVGEDHKDIIDEIQHTLIVTELTQPTRLVLVEAMKEIESLRMALKIFSDEFENLQKMDAVRSGMPYEQ